MEIYRNLAVQIKSEHTGSNYAVIHQAKAGDKIVNMWVNSEINNSELPAFDPPPPDGVQYDADRQVQLRNYAYEIKQYSLAIYFKPPNKEAFKRKIVPLYKYYPDHQVDIFPLMWNVLEAGREEGSEILARFEGDYLPVENDSITVFVDIKKTVDKKAKEVWFNVSIEANKESIIVFPTGTTSYSFKQRNGVKPLKWSKKSGVFEEIVDYDLLDIAFEESSLTVDTNSLHFTCEIDGEVLVKAIVG